MNNKRALTMEEIKSMLLDLGHNITEEGADLYQSAVAKFDKLPEWSDDLNDKVQDIRDDLTDLVAKVNEEGQGIIHNIQGRMDMLTVEIDEELAEIKESGILTWIVNNPQYSITIATAIFVLLYIIF